MTTITLATLKNLRQYVKSQLAGWGCINSGGCGAFALGMVEGLHANGVQADVLCTEVGMSTDEALSCLLHDEYDNDCLSHVVVGVEGMALDSDDVWEHTPTQFDGCVAELELFMSVLATDEVWNDWFVHANRDMSHNPRQELRAAVRHATTTFLQATAEA